MTHLYASSDLTIKKDDERSVSSSTPVQKQTNQDRNKSREELVTEGSV